MRSDVIHDDIDIESLATGKTEGPTDWARIFTKIRAVLRPVKANDIITV